MVFFFLLTEKKKRFKQEQSPNFLDVSEKDFKKKLKRCLMRGITMMTWQFRRLCVLFILDFWLFFSCFPEGDTSSSVTNTTDFV